MYDHFYLDNKNEELVCIIPSICVSNKKIKHAFKHAFKKNEVNLILRYRSATLSYWPLV